MTNKTTSAVAAVVCIITAVAMQTRAQHQGKRKVTEAEARAVIRAVEDEIYDYGYQEEFAVVDAPAAKAPKKAIMVRIYINPEIDADGTGGEVIYKLMPYGEVYRDYGILQSGLVALDGDPFNGFPPTDEYARKTVYMDEDLVFRMKRAWLKHSFEVDQSPDDRTLSEAGRRQKLRTGYSHWEAAQTLKKKLPK